MKEIKQIELNRTFWSTGAVLTTFYITYSDNTIQRVDDTTITPEIQSTVTEFIKNCCNVTWKKRKTHRNKLNGDIIYARYE